MASQPVECASHSVASNRQAPAPQDQVVRPPCASHQQCLEDAPQSAPSGPSTQATDLFLRRKPNPQRWRPVWWHAAPKPHPLPRSMPHIYARTTHTQVRPLQPVPLHRFRPSCLLHPHPFRHPLFLRLNTPAGGSQCLPRAIVHTTISSRWINAARPAYPKIVSI